MRTMRVMAGSTVASWNNTVEFAELIAARAKASGTHSAERGPSAARQG